MNTRGERPSPCVDINCTCSQIKDAVAKKELTLVLKTAMLGVQCTTIFNRSAKLHCQCIWVRLFKSVEHNMTGDLQFLTSLKPRWFVPISNSLGATLCRMDLVSGAHCQGCAFNLVSHRPEASIWTMLLKPEQKYCAAEKCVILALKACRMLIQQSKCWADAFTTHILQKTKDKPKHGASAVLSKRQQSHVHLFTRIGRCEHHSKRIRHFCYRLVGSTRRVHLRLKCICKYKERKPSALCLVEGLPLKCSSEMS